MINSRFTFAQHAATRNRSTYKALLSAIVVTLCSLGAILPTLASADDANWFPSQHGADDTLGAINHLSPAIVKKAAKLVKTGKTYSLGVNTGPTSPAYPPRSNSLPVLSPGDGTGATMGKNRATGNDDLLHTWMGIGSQIDGLGHMGIDHVYYNGNRAQDFVTPRGLTKLAIHELPPIVSRGVLLDMAAYYDANPVPAGTAFNSEEIKAAAKAQKIKIRRGDVVLFHTGWLNVMDSDPERFMAGEPGIGLVGAKYLASLDVVAVGSDSWSVEVLPGEDPDIIFPVHPELLAKNGIYILENMDTRALAADQAWEFLFVLGQPKFEGAVQAVINPIAIR